LYEDGEMLPLFDEPGTFQRDRLAAKLKRLADQQIYIGTSSWKYEGWCGQIYSRERYVVRGRFAQKRFESECLSEYSEVFPAVCGDFSFYQFPSAEYWKRLFGSAGPDLLFAFKVPEDITVMEFPMHPRYGPRAGVENPSFLDADLFRANMTDLLEPYAGRVASLIFEFGTLPKRAFEDVGQFVARLDRFLQRLPAGFQYSVEIRNPEFLIPEYFDCLKAHAASLTCSMPGRACRNWRSKSASATRGPRTTSSRGRCCGADVRMRKPWRSSLRTSRCRRRIRGRVERFAR
jgi:uncharacterized protein YecE (DUF72 family)